MSLVDQATQYTARKHEGQYRPGLNIPYSTHLFGVARILKAANYEEDIVVAGLLHDKYIILIASVVLALLLVSEIPMFSLKFKKGSPYNRIRFTFAGIVAAIAIAAFILKINWGYIVLLSLTCYIFFNLLLALPFGGKGNNK